MPTRRSARYRPRTNDAQSLPGRGWRSRSFDLHDDSTALDRVGEMIFRPEQAIVDSQRLAHAVAAALEAGDHVVIVPVAAIGRAECDLHRQRAVRRRAPMTRSEEHTTELQSLMRITYAVFCLKK